MPVDARPGAAVSDTFQRTLESTPFMLKQYPFYVGEYLKTSELVPLEHSKILHLSRQVPKGVFLVPLEHSNILRLSE